MMKYISPEGHNWGPIFLDALGLAYIVVIIAWSLFVLCCLLLTVLKRALPFIRMRSLTLIASTLVSLHVYLVMTFLVYSLNGTFSCEAEFWVMSVYLPFGIACFHVQNMQLYSLSRLQRQLISSGPTHSATTGQNTNSWFGGLVMRFRRRNALQQTRILTYVGMGLQVSLLKDHANIFPNVLCATADFDHVVGCLARHLSSFSKVPWLRRCLPQGVSRRMSSRLGVVRTTSHLGQLHS